MIVILRFRVTPSEQAEFVERTGQAIRVLAERPGWSGGELGRNIDEPELWTLVTRWAGVGSYRRALGGYESKLHVVPLLSLAIDEPSAYLLLDELESEDLGG